MNRTTWSTCWRRLQRRADARRRGVRQHVCLEILESRQVLSVADLFRSAIALDLNSNQPHVGFVSESPTYYAFSVLADGRLTVGVEPSAGAARLTLLSADGEVLVQSVGRSPHNPNGLIDLHLLGSPAGRDYYLAVEPLGDSVGSFVLTTDYAATTTPVRADAGRSGTVV